MTYRIVNTDNFGGDYPNEKFVEGEFENIDEAHDRADKLNGPDDDNPRYFMVVAMPYELKPGVEP